MGLADSLTGECKDHVTWNPVKGLPYPAQAIREVPQRTKIGWGVTSQASDTVWVVSQVKRIAIEKLMGRSPCWPIQGSEEGWGGGWSWHRNIGLSPRSPKLSTFVTKVPTWLPVPAWDLANWLPGQWSVDTGKSSDTLCVFQTSVHKYPYLYSGISVCLGELIKEKRVRNTLLPFSSSLMVSLNVEYHLLLLGLCERLPSHVWALYAFCMIPGYVANRPCLHCFL